LERGDHVCRHAHSSVELLLRGDSTKRVMKRGRRREAQQERTASDGLGESPLRIQRISLASPGLWGGSRRFISGDPKEGVIDLYSIKTGVISKLKNPRRNNIKGFYGNTSHVLLQRSERGRNDAIKEDCR